MASIRVLYLNVNSTKFLATEALMAKIQLENRLESLQFMGPDHGTSDFFTFTVHINRYWLVGKNICLWYKKSVV